MFYINGEKITDNMTEKLTTLHDACQYFSDDSEAVATALNGLFVPKSLRQTTLLSDGDQIEIIAPIEGG